MQAKATCAVGMPVLVGPVADEELASVGEGEAEIAVSIVPGGVDPDVNQRQEDVSDPVGTWRCDRHYRFRQ